ncbi:MAG: amidohydrolase family protein [Gemmatimonadetes bacterium]|nr:amidohydrolase family protein [Gemmatimonadota bacterium]
MSLRKVYLAKRVANEAVDGWLDDHAVIIDQDRIESVLPGSHLPRDIAENAEVHNLGDVSLLPGLIDAHCHMHCSATANALQHAMTDTDQQLTMRAVTAMRRALLAGTTTIRDIGSRNDVAFPVREAIKSGTIPGPRLLVSGQPITITAGHCWFFSSQADTTEGVVKAVRTQVRLGADLIKVMATGGMFTPTANPARPQYSTETLREAVEEAERVGIPIVAHTLAAEGVQRCVEAGVHHHIHARWRARDPDPSLDYRPDVVARLVDLGHWVDPTIGHIYRGTLASHQSAGRSGSAASASTDGHLELLRRMDEAGVRFTSGLDMGMPHAPHDGPAANAWAFVDWMGWSPWRALRTLTRATSEAIGLGDTVGQIKPGLVADLAAFDGDPAADIRQLDIASSVVQAGDLVKHNQQTLV